MNPAPKPKRQMSQKQLDALARGRESRKGRKNGSAMALPEMEGLLASPVQAELSMEPIAIPEPKKRSFTDKLRETFAASPEVATKKTAAKVKEAKEHALQFVDQIVPIFALLIVWGMTIAINKEEYKVLAPQYEEASAMVSPIARMVGRQLKAAGKLNENTLDILAFLLATGLYGHRAYNDYKRIKEYERERTSASYSTTLTNAPANAYLGDSSRNGQVTTYSSNSGQAPVEPGNERPSVDGGRGVDPMVNLIKQSAQWVREQGIN